MPNYERIALLKQIYSDALNEFERLDDLAQDLHLIWGPRDWAIYEQAQDAVRTAYDEYQKELPSAALIALTDETFHDFLKDTEMPSLGPQTKVETLPAYIQPGHQYEYVQFDPEPVNPAKAYVKSKEYRRVILPTKEYFSAITRKYYLVAFSIRENRVFVRVLT